MSKDKWDNLTNDTNDLIQKAIESGNYNSLKRDVTTTIERAINSAIDIGRRTIENPPAPNYNKNNPSASRTVKVNRNGNTVEINNSYAERVRKPNPSKTGAAKYTYNKTVTYTADSRYISNARLLIGGWLKSLIGGFMGIISIGAMFSDGEKNYLGVQIAFLLMAIGFTYMFYRGVSTLVNRRKFKKYRDVLKLSETGDYASISDLADATKESERKTGKRLKMMISKNWFREGYMDKMETTFMSSNNAYKLYKQSVNSYEMRMKEEELNKPSSERDVLQKEKPANGNLPPEVRDVLETGSRYLREMKSLNDRIPGEKVSDKIERIEILTARILARVESHPESVDETKQLMKYYLPMIIKLLNAYADMDEQPKPGQNIEKSKKEIEGVLDELNIAFERLLDNLYKDTAWDVASDISVLNAMLKREGLKSDEFTMSEGDGSSENGEIKLHL